jgi:hypothetical protein
MNDGRAQLQETKFVCEFTTVGNIRRDDTSDNKWARVAMCSQMLNIPIDMPEDIKEEWRGTSWARATRELRRLRHRIEVVGGSKDQWETGVWHMDKEQWNLLWTGEQAFWKVVPHLMAAGHRTAEALTEPRKLDTGRPYKIPQLMAAQERERKVVVTGPFIIFCFTITA